jgi:predicted Na+-dependent transporter
MRTAMMCAIVLVMALLFSLPASALGAEGDGAQVRSLSGEAMYKHLQTMAADGGLETPFFQRLDETSRDLQWAGVEQVAFVGYLRKLETGEGPESRTFYFVRAVSGEVYILAMPVDRAVLESKDDSAYAGLDDMVGKKTQFKALILTKAVDGVAVGFMKLEAKPERLLLDRLFFVAIVILLFLTMMGMGLTLTPKDFALVFKSPKGMIVGPVCQFGLMPVLAMILGRLFGFYEDYPFIFLGLILISTTPGGVTSNLMTYFGKGDVALSVSLTALCTVLALFLTPLLLQVFGPNIPSFSIPVVEVFKTMLVLVVVPLFVGMLIRWRFEGFARKAEKTFALIGIFALLFLIIVGVWSTLDKFADTQRYGLTFYAVIFMLTFAGMLVAGVISKLLGIRNYQVRAISLETGLRNASLAMTIALLLQDQMGDFYSSMFFTSGVFGLWMYVAGMISIYVFPKVLPLSKEELAMHQAAHDAKP